LIINKNLIFNGVSLYFQVRGPKEEEAQLFQLFGIN